MTTKKLSSKLSFEVFPPKKEASFQDMFSVLDEIAELHPEFISVTYGAGGSDSKKTVDIADYIQNKLGIATYAHLTCVGNKKTDIDTVLDALDSKNITRILGLRGDRPKDMSDEQYDSREFKYANELITYIKETKPHMQIIGACYPEKHFEATSTRADLARLYDKVNAGCEFLISQLFFQNDVFYRFQENCAANGINVPIHAGIMPITSAKQIQRTISLSGTSVPKQLADLVARYGNDPQDMYKAGIDYAIKQITDLQEHNVDGIHLYSMNRVDVTKDIVNAVG